MKLGESVRISWRSITGHKLRSTLTTLGVVIGIASVITFMVLGGAFEEDILGDVEEQDEQPVLQVQTQSTPQNGFGLVTVSSPVYTETDVEAIGAIDGVEHVAPQGEIPSSQLRHGDESTTSFSVQATTPERFEQDGLVTMASGTTFSGPDEAIVNTAAARSFEENLTTGDEITVSFADGEQRTFTVSGLVNEDVGGQTASPGVYVSVDDHYAVTLETPRGTEERAYEQLHVRTESVDDVESVQEQAQSYFDTESDASQLVEGSATIRVQTFEDVIGQVTGLIDDLRTFIGGIAAISLVVGAFGIANIMIVSVTERTREIGIMKAVGARKRDVVQLFLAESAILGTVGAVFGVLVGLGAGYLAVSAIGWPMVYPWNWVGIAVAVGVGVGILSGLYPAWRAARVDPIEALRRE